MTEFDKAEFREALGRLYTETVALREATQALARVAEAHSNRLDRVEIIIENGIQSHEQRMQRIEARHEEMSNDLELFKQRQEAELEQIRELNKGLQELRQIAQAHEKRLGGIH